MRIAFISREYPPEQSFGGIGTTIGNMAEGLAQLGHEVEVFGLGEKARTELQNGVLVHRTTLRDVNSLVGMTLIDCSYTANVFTFANAFWRCFVRRHSEAPFDVLDSGELFADALGNAFSRLLPHLVRLYTPQFLINESRFHGMKPTADLVLAAVLEQFLTRRAQMVTSPSRALAETVAERWSIPLEDIPIIPNPVNTDMFFPARKREDRPPTLLFVGRLDIRKGFDIFMRALPEVFAAVPDVQVRVVGETNPNDHSFDEELRSLKEESERRGDSDRITYVGCIGRKAISEQYRMADVAAVPSRYDNSPHVIAEELCCGVPVVGAAAGGIPEYLGYGKAGVLVPPENPSALARAIVELLKDPGRRSELGAAGRRWVTENYDRRVVARRTVGLYEEVRRRFEAGFTFDSSAQSSPPNVETVLEALLKEKPYIRDLTPGRVMRALMRRLKAMIR